MVDGGFAAVCRGNGEWPAWGFAGWFIAL